MAIPQTQLKPTPEWPDTLALFRKDLFLSLNCHAIATVESFNASKQTCEATVVYKRSILQAQEDGTYSTVLVDFPLLVDVPVLILGGSDSYLSFPTESLVGTDALILFNDRDINNWFEGANGKGCQSPRLHSFGDGIAIVGLRSKANSISYEEAKVVLKNAGAALKIGTKFNIQNEMASLYTVLNTLLTDMITVFTAMSSATPPTVVAAIATPSATLVTQLTVIQTTLGELLE